MRITIIVFWSMISATSILMGMQRESLVSSRGEQLKQMIATAEKEKVKKSKDSHDVPPYQGPTTFDIICTSIYLKNGGLFALADQNTGATTIYPSEAPFSVRAILKNPSPSCGSYSLSTNGQKIATVSGNDVVIWDIEAQSKVATLKGHINWIESVAFNPNNSSQLVSGSFDTTIKVWDINSKKCVQTLNDDAPVFSAQFNPENSNQIVSVNKSDSNALALWSLQEVRKQACANSKWSAVYNHAGTNIIASFDKQLILYDANLNQVKSLEIPVSEDNSAATTFDFSADDATVVIGGLWQNILICDGQLNSVKDNFDSGMLGVDVHYDPQAKKILSSSFGCPIDGGGSVRIWDISQVRQRKIDELKKPVGRSCQVQ